jgi:hypothetical protein
LGKYLVCRCAAQLIYVLLYVGFNNYLLACHYDSLKVVLVFFLSYDFMMQDQFDEASF